MRRLRRRAQLRWRREIGSGLLSADTQDRVDQIDAVAGPICDGTVPMEANAALGTVEAALIALIEAKGNSDGG